MILSNHNLFSIVYFTKVLVKHQKYLVQCVHMQTLCRKKSDILASYIYYTISLKKSISLIILLCILKIGQ